MTHHLNFTLAVKITYQTPKISALEITSGFVLLPTFTTMHQRKLTNTMHKKVTLLLFLTLTACSLLSQAQGIKKIAPDKQRALQWKPE